MSVKLDGVLRALETCCTVPDLAAHLQRDRRSVQRHLRRAELAELVKVTEGRDVHVWELTEQGAERLARRETSEATS